MDSRLLVLDAIVDVLKTGPAGALEPSGGHPSGQPPWPRHVTTQLQDTAPRISLLLLLPLLQVLIRRQPAVVGAGGEHEQQLKREEDDDVEDEEANGEVRLEREAHVEFAGRDLHVIKPAGRGVVREEEECDVGDQLTARWDQTERGERRRGVWRGGCEVCGTSCVVVRSPTCITSAARRRKLKMMILSMAVM